MVGWVRHGRSERENGVGHESMNRRGFLRFSGLAGAGALVAGFGLSSAGKGGEGVGRGTKRPNVLFIMSDDHASHAIGCYGSKINETPHLDRLGKEGMRLDNCFCTNSICAPSRAVILTGTYSHVNGVVDNRTRFDGSQDHVGKRMREAGYETAMIGKWHLKSEPTGFDYWHVLPGQGSYHNPAMIDNGRRVRHEGYVTDVITDLTLEWLKGRSSDRPFFLMCHHKAPHRNWSPSQAKWAKWKDRRIPQPETLGDDWETKSDAAREQKMTIERHMRPRDVGGAWPEGLKGKELREWKYQRYMRRYLACIESVDDSVGRLLDYLDEAGLAEDTIVVYTSDQGFYLGDHGWFDKRFMYEESLRMPLLVRYPRAIKPGSTSEAMVLNLDFAETFLDYAGAEIPLAMQGRSARGVLEGTSPDDWRTSMYYHYYEYPGAHAVKRHYGVRTTRYKLIHFYHDIDAWELYDLRADPEELRNVYDDPAYAEVVERLEAELKRLRTKYKVPRDKVGRQA
jgi:arylsulfatase A-like enzyme